MKKTVFCVLVLSLSLAVIGPAFAETDAAQTPKAETPAAEKTAEELYQTG